jgi:methanol metabolism-related c-type cytochrome
MSSGITPWILLVAAVAPATLMAQESAYVDSPEKAAAVRDEDGKYLDAEGNPTFKIEPDGTVDWYTFSGYRRYHSTCHVCHGPDGEGSTVGPPLVESLKRMDYGTFASIVAEGRQNVSAARQSVMPAFGDNKNVYCYIDDLYVYLRARAVGGLPRGRPAKHAEKPKSAQEHESTCMGG